MRSWFLRFATSLMVLSCSAGVMSCQFEIRERVPSELTTSKEMTDVNDRTYKVSICTLADDGSKCIHLNGGTLNHVQGLGSGLLRFGRSISRCG